MSTKQAVKFYQQHSSQDHLQAEFFFPLQHSYCLYIQIVHKFNYEASAVLDFFFLKVTIYWI